MIDLGDFVPGMGKPAEIKTALYTTALPKMGYDVVGTGEIDVRPIKDSGKSPFEQVGIPQICANLINSETKKPILQKPYIIKKMPTGLRVAIIGVIGTTQMNIGLSKQIGVEVLPPEETVRKIMGELNGKADIFVVMAHTGYQDAKKLAESVPGINIVLGSHPSPGINIDFERVGETILMQCKGSSKYIGKLVLNIDAEGKIGSAVGTEDLLDAKMAKDPAMQKLVDDTDAAVTEYYNGVNGNLMPNTPGAGNVSSEPRPFVGPQRCLACHNEIANSWKKTKHAQAFGDMARKDVNAKMNPDCLSCHTTGYGAKGGFTSETETSYLRGVSCEACHGPGLGHLQKPSEKGYGLSVSEATCRRCHDGTNSPKFDYAKYREQIAHPKK